MLYYKDIRRLFIMKNKSGYRTAPGFTKASIIGCCAIAVIFTLISFIVTLIVYSTDDPTSKAGLLSIISFVAAGAVGAFINMKLFGKALPAVPYVSSGAALLLFLIISLIAGGRLSAGNLMSALCFAAVTLLVLFLSRSRNSAKHRRRRV